MILIFFLTILALTFLLKDFTFKEPFAFFTLTVKVIFFLASFLAFTAFEYLESVMYCERLLFVLVLTPVPECFLLFGAFVALAGEG